MELTDKRYVYNYCKKCSQATPHTVIINGHRSLLQKFQYIDEVLAKCNYCGNKIEVEWREE